MNIVFSNIDFSDYNTFCDGSELWRKPQKVVDNYSIPGKNGDVVISQDKYSNITRPFSCHIPSNWQSNYNALIDALSSVEGYGRFETDEESDVFMMAQFNAEIQPSMWQFNARGTFTLNFDFKPQKWLKSGEEAIEVNNTISVVNPTSQKAYPLLAVVGTGSVTINDSILTLANNTSTTYIDCELQDCYEGIINRNSDLTIVNGFPVLTDTNTVSMSGFTSVNLIPRWWRL